MITEVNLNSRTVTICKHGQVLVLDEDEVQGFLNTLRLKDWAKRPPLSQTERDSAMVVSSSYEDNHE